ncbi:BON domain-containing protein [Elongatibacter sediminis]|uniref:BON domain-containing protein n=1 Tax=Elongatibacter sediminis TaxID=3119006 RepID=A0AAW9RJT2_9GAMM
MKYQKRHMALFFSASLLAAIPAAVAAGEERSAGQVIDDMSIAARAKAALAADPVTDAIKIDLEVDQDRVQMNGFVDNEQERDRAQEILMSIEGVAIVDNNLRIQSHDRTTGVYVDDKVLQARVKTALADHPVAHSLKVDIEVDRGVVSLGGHVDSETERDAALSAAARVAGVTKVINNLDVRS